MERVLDIRRSLGGRACSATRAAPRTTKPNATGGAASVAAPYTLVRKTEMKMIGQNRPDRVPEDRPPEWSRQQARVREDRDERAERGRRERDCEQPPRRVDAGRSRARPRASPSREEVPAHGSASQRIAWGVVFDHLQPGEEEEQGEPEIREEGDVVVHISDVNPLRPDEDPEDDLDDDRRQRDAQMPPREDRSQRGGEEDSMIGRASSA